MAEVEIKKQKTQKMLSWKENLNLTNMKKKKHCVENKINRRT